MTIAAPPRPPVTLPAGPRPRPVVGSTFDFSRDQLGFVTRMQRRYGNAVHVQLMGGFTLVMLFSPAAVRTILTEQPRNFTSREFNAILLALLGDGLLTIDGDFHRSQRRLVQPAFHKKRIEAYATIMTDHTTELLDRWQPGQTFDMAAAMQQLTLRIVAKTLFDVDLRDSAELGRAFSDVINFPSDRRLAWENLLRFDLPFLPYHRYLRGRRTLDAAVYRIIAARRADQRDTGDVVSMVLAAQDDDGTTMTDQQVRDEIMTFFAAGHETTANNLAWTWYLLSGRPDVFARLRAELDAVLGGRTPTVADLPQLTYTDMVIKESLRLYPPAWAIGRRATEAFDIEGYHLPAGQIVLLSQWVTHRLPEIWGADAGEFRPERFDPQQPQAVPPFAYFPFGGGPRMCIGMPFAQMEARLLLATIAQRFYPRVTPGFVVAPQPMVTLRPKYGLRMTLFDAHA